MTKQTTFVHLLNILMIDVLVSMTTAEKSVVLSSLRVNSVTEPLSIDDRFPFFSWRVDANGLRGVVASGYELEVSRLHTNGTTELLWNSGFVKSNQTQFIPYPTDGPALVSNSDYYWKVRASSPDSEWSQSRFSTGLFQPSDWHCGRVLLMSVQPETPKETI